MAKVFISFPYYDKEPAITAERVSFANNYCVQVKKSGSTPFAPAVMGHFMVNHSDYNIEDMTFKNWDEMCYDYLEGCDELHVLMYDGWDRSRGIAHEIKRATELNIPIIYIEK